MPNAELAYKVLDHIDAHPESWDQANWITLTDCGTAACFAGWTCLLSGDEPTWLGRAPLMIGPPRSTTSVRVAGLFVHDISHRASDLLGILGDGAHDLFSPLHDRESLGIVVEEIFGLRPE